MRHVIKIHSPSCSIVKFVFVQGAASAAAITATAAVVTVAVAGRLASDGNSINRVFIGRI